MALYLQSPRSGKTKKYLTFNFLFSTSARLVRKLEHFRRPAEPEPHRVRGSEPDPADRRPAQCSGQAGACGAAPEVRLQKELISFNYILTLKN